MKQYHIQLRVENGGTQNVQTTTDRQYAASYCKTRNEANQKAGSPNRYFFEETEE